MILRQIFAMIRKSGTAVILMMFFAWQGFVFAPFCSDAWVTFGDDSVSITGAENVQKPVILDQRPHETHKAKRVAK